VFGQALQQKPLEEALAFVPVACTISSAGRGVVRGEGAVARTR
jgi:hypothetical protein